MREILRRVRKQLAAEKRAVPAAPPRARPEPPGDEPPAGGGPEDGPAAGGAREGSAAPPLPAAPPPRPPLGQRMRRRCQAALAALAEAMTAGRAHLCLTDPDARMMGGGREQKVRECHSYEVAVDREAGLLVAAQVSQDASDNALLI